MRKRVANLTSNVLSPFWLGLVLIFLLSFVEAPNLLDALKWSLLAMALTILPVFLVILYLVQKGKLDSVFTNVREQRTKIYLLGGLCIAVCCIILIYLKAPSELIAGFIAGISMTLIFMCINLWWKISLHTAFVAGSATVVVILYGGMATATLALIPLMAWARIELKCHSLAQVAAGAVLATSIAIAAFYPFLHWLKLIG